MYDAGLCWANGREHAIELVEWMHPVWGRLDELYTHTDRQHPCVLQTSPDYGVAGVPGMRDHFQWLAEKPFGFIFWSMSDDIKRPIAIIVELCRVEAGW